MEYDEAVALIENFNNKEAKSQVIREEEAERKKVL